MYHDFNFDLAAAQEIAPKTPGQIGRPQTKTSSLFDLDMLDAEKKPTAKMLVELARNGRRSTIGFVNAHCINVASHDDRYRTALNNCDYLLPDGSGMRVASRLAGAPYGDNLNGTDLFPMICEEAAQRGVSIYLLGGQHGVAEATSEEMCRRYPGLRIAGVQHGYFEERETRRIIEDINASGADMLFVGFGVPLQECWLDDHGASLDTPVQLSVGGLFDYYSGRIPRAPLPVRNAGCEWIWRLAQEPRRLANRYFTGNAVFMAHACMHAATRRTGIDFIEAAKRAGDFLATFIGLMILAPVFLAIALAIKIEDRGPVFFTQTRIGKGGRPFRVLKFRSMVCNAEKLQKALLAQSERDDVCFKMKRDPRITRVGALLRRTSMDELPQLINVLIGDMSLVGPRPALPQEVTAYWERAMKRLDTRPGITCIWQVSGRAEIPFSQQVEMDIDYVEHHGPLRDLYLLLRTVPAVITARGAY